MGVVIEICIKHPGGPTRMTVTDIIQYLARVLFLFLFVCVPVLICSAGTVPAHR
jgi:hypothetical protein